MVMRWRPWVGLWKEREGGGLVGVGLWVWDGMGGKGREDCAAYLCIFYLVRGLVDVELVCHGEGSDGRGGEVISFGDEGTTTRSEGE